MKKIFFIATLLFLLSCNNHEPNQQNDQSNLPVLLSDILNQSGCVFLAEDENNQPLISWTETDSIGNKYFYFAGWDTKAQKFGDRISIPIESSTSIHEEGMPKIAVKGDGTIVAIYETSVPSEKSKYGFGDIQYVMSTDKGKTWTHHQSIQPVKPDSLSRSFSNIIRLDDGEIGVSWLGTHPGDDESGRLVMFAKTNDNNSFDAIILIEDFACQCCRTALSSDGFGNVSVVFRDLLSGSIRDISASSSNDNGRTFSRSVPFSDDHWMIDGCPHNGPSVVSNDGKKFVTWFTGPEENGVYYAALDANNHMLLKRHLAANGRFVQLCLMPGGTRIVAFNAHYRQNDSMYSKIMVNKIDDKGFFEKEISLPGVHASYPVVVPTDSSHVIIAWSDNDQVFYRLINTNTVTDIANEESPQSFAVKTAITLPALSYSMDPVCRMKVNQSTANDTTSLNGSVIGFCSHACKEKFLKDPGAYALRK